MVRIKLSILSFQEKYNILFLERADEEKREMEAKIKLKKKHFRDLLKESHVSIKYEMTFVCSYNPKNNSFV